MTLLTNLCAEAVPAPDWVEPRGTLNAVHCEVAPGQLAHVTLGGAGLVIRRGKETWGISIRELLDLVFPQSAGAPAAPAPRPPSDTAA